MTNVENGVFWITGDSVWGRVHSNDNLTVSGSPVFLAKVTTAKGFIPPLGKTGKIGGTNYTNKAKFKNPPQPETGVARIDFPTDLTGLARCGGRPKGGNTQGTSGSRWTARTLPSAATARHTSGQRRPVRSSILLQSADPSFNGVIQGTGIVNVQGTLDGKLTIASYSTPLATNNDLIIQGDILYEKNPRYGPSDDVLGLVANNDVIVADNVPAGGNREIDGSIFARTGSFGAENYRAARIQGRTARPRLDRPEHPRARSELSAGHHAQPRILQTLSLR